MNIDKVMYEYNVSEIERLDERFAALRSVFCLIRMFKFSTMLKGKN